MVYKLEHLGSGGLPNCTQQAALPMDVEEFALAVQNDRYIHISGGRGTNSKQTAVLDTVPDLWLSRPVMNHGRANHAAMVLDKHLYVIGGEAGETLQNSIECRKLDAQSPW